MKTKIIRIEITPIELALREPFVISKGSLSVAKNTVIRITIGAGLTGSGECSSYRSIHAETQQGSMAAAQKLGALLLGEDAREIRKCVRLMDMHFVGNASIKCAFDMALYDLNAQLCELPLYRYLQGDGTKVIHTDMTISLLAKEMMVEKALEYQEQGFPALKVKLGDRPSSRDVDRMIAIREAVGTTLPLRIDANQGWNYLEASQALQLMEHLDIEHCEAPVSGTNFIDLKKLNHESPIPIMGDESVFSHQDAYRMLAHDCVKLINIKLGKSGGINHAMKIASVAEAAGVYCQVGCFSESRLAITALTHFAKAWEHIIYYDLDSPLMQEDDPVLGGLFYQSDWEVTIDESIGIGATFDDAFLKRFDQIIIKSK